MWNFFKKLFGGGKQEQTQIAEAGSVAVQAGNSINMINIRTAQTLKWEDPPELSDETKKNIERSMEQVAEGVREANQRALERIGGRLIADPIYNTVSRSALHNAELQRQWGDTLRETIQPQGLNASSLLNARGGTINNVDLFKKTQPAQSAIDHDRLQRDRQNRLREEEERRLRILNSSYIGSDYTEPVQYPAPVHNTHHCTTSNHTYDFGHSHSHSCPVSDHGSVSVSVTNMD